jgi:DNA-binding CsgD family transcriptional regulator
MIVRPHLILHPYTIIMLNHLTFPDFENNMAFLKFIMHEWTMPPDMLDGFEIPPEVDVIVRISPIFPQGNYALMFLTFSESHMVKAKPVQLPLTEDQQEVIQLMRRGLTDKQMALRLNRSRRWVQYRLSELKQYYGVETRIQLEIKIAQPPILRRS